VTLLVQPPPTGPPPCNNPGTDAPGAGGCSIDCYCDTSVTTNTGICDNTADRALCSNACSTDADCGTGRSCITTVNIQGNCGSAVCILNGVCTSSVSKRDLFGFGAGDFGGRRMSKRVDGGRKIELLDGQVIEVVDGKSVRVSDGKVIEVSNGLIVS
jgi:hypothetical protein